jgi:hypothetical protein
MAMAGLMGEAQLIAELADEWRRHLDAKHPGRVRYDAVGLTLQREPQFVTS